MVEAERPDGPGARPESRAVSEFFTVLHRHVFVFNHLIFLQKLLSSPGIDAKLCSESVGISYRPGFISWIKADNVLKSLHWSDFCMKNYRVAGASGKWGVARLQSLHQGDDRMFEMLTSRTWKASIALGIVALLALPGAASATVLTFAGPIGEILPGSPTVEDIYRYDAMPGGALFRQSSGNPLPSIQGRTVTGGDVFRVVRDDIAGGRFVFDSVDIAKNNGGATEIVFEGYLGNVLQAVDTFLTTALNFDFLNVSSLNLSGVVIDELRVILDAGLFPTPIETIDNLELNVAEPTTLALLGLSLAGLGWRRRRGH